MVRKIKYTGELGGDWVSPDGGEWSSVLDLRTSIALALVFVICAVTVRVLFEPDFSPLEVLPAVLPVLYGRSLRMVVLVRDGKLD